MAFRPKAEHNACAIASAFRLLIGESIHGLMTAPGSSGEVPQILSPIASRFY